MYELTGMYITLGFFIGVTATAVIYYIYTVMKAREEYEYSLDDAAYRKYHEFLHMTEKPKKVY